MNIDEYSCMNEEFQAIQADKWRIEVSTVVYVQ